MWQKNKKKITCLTAYTYPMAKILDGICDVILVGDSLGMCVYGFPDTVDVTLEMMINHGKAVMRGVEKSLVIIDMPCGSYEESPKQALTSARRIIDETGCYAIKMETDKNLADTVELLVKNNIKVMGHVGLMPQHVRKIGGYKYQGLDEKSSQEILETSQAIANAGAFALVIEAVPEKLADRITNNINIPTIGIGASINCDGQVLVIDDLIGLNTDFKPKFVKRYTEVSNSIKTAAQQFCLEVETKKFPAVENIKK